MRALLFVLGILSFSPSWAGIDIYELQGCARQLQSSANRWIDEDYDDFIYPLIGQAFDGKAVSQMGMLQGKEELTELLAAPDLEVSLEYKDQELGLLFVSLEKRKYRTIRLGTARPLSNTEARANYKTLGRGLRQNFALAFPLLTADARPFYGGVHLMISMSAENAKPTVAIADLKLLGAFFHIKPNRDYWFDRATNLYDFNEIAALPVQPPINF